MLRDIPGRELMRGRNRNLLTLSYLGAEHTMPNYNMVGMAKASLETGVRARWSPKELVLITEIHRLFQLPLTFKLLDTGLIALDERAFQRSF